MEIITILNNNALIAKEQGKRETVVFGKGIGFQKRKGDIVDKDKIETIYVRSDDSFALSASDIPYAFLKTTNEILLTAKQEGIENLKDSLFFSLADHLYMMIERLKEGINVGNPFLHDIKMYFPHEFSIALKAKDIIKKNLGVEVDEEECGLIALHIIEENMLLRDTVSSKEVLELVKEITNIVLKDLHLEDIDRCCYQYSRLVTHIKFFVYRYISGTELQDEIDSDMQKLVDLHFKEELRTTERISEYLNQRFHKNISRQEKVYLYIHFRNCRLASNRK